MRNAVVAAAMFSSFLSLVAAGPARAATAALVAFNDVAKELDPVLRRQAAKLESISLQPASTTAQEVAAAKKLGVACGMESVDCLVKLAVLLRVDKLVAAAGVRQPDGIALDLVLVDAGLGREAARETFRIPLPDDKRSAALEDAIERLIEPDKHFGSLVVELAEDGALILIDGAPQIAAAFPRARFTLREGPHDVQVKKAGKKPWGATATVRAGDEVALAATLQDDGTAVPPASPPPAAAPATSWADSPLVLPGVLLVVGGGAAFATAGATALTLEALLSLTTVGNAEERKGMLIGERLTAIGAGVAVLVAAAGGGLILLAVANEE